MLLGIQFLKKNNSFSIKPCNWLFLTFDEWNVTQQILTGNVTLCALCPLCFFLAGTRTFNLQNFILRDNGTVNNNLTLELINIVSKLLTLDCWKVSNMVLRIWLWCESFAFYVTVLNAMVRSFTVTDKERDCSTTSVKNISMQNCMSAENTSTSKRQNRWIIIYVWCWNMLIKLQRKSFHDNVNIDVLQYVACRN